MNRFTLQQLCVIARTHNVPNRSKYTKKADLYDFLVGILGEDLDGESKDSSVPKKSVFRQKKLTEYQKTKPKLCVVTTYDYVVVQCLSTEKLFPMTDQQENGDYYVNKFVCYFHGHDNDFDGVWAIHHHEQGPIGFKGAINAPFKIEYLFTGNRDYSSEYVGLHEESGHWIVGKDTVIKMEDLEGWALTPLIDPEIVGYEDILEEYGDYDTQQDSYLIEEYKEFAGKITERSKCWNFVPSFVTHLRKVLTNRDLKHDNVVIFAGVPSDQIQKLKEHILASGHDDSTGFESTTYIPLEDGRNLIYLRTG